MRYLQSKIFWVGASQNVFASRASHGQKFDILNLHSKILELEPCLKYVQRQNRWTKSNVKSNRVLLNVFDIRLTFKRKKGTFKNTFKIFRMYCKDSENQCL